MPPFVRKKPVYVNEGSSFRSGKPLVRGEQSVDDIRRRRHIDGPLLRLLAGSLGCVIGLVLYLRWLSVPWSVGNRVSRDVRQLEIRLRERRIETAKLRQRLAYINSPAGIEALARTRGYHRPGEQVYLEATSSPTQNP